jgi:glycerophosphoryl diester phosphodiesterase
MTRIVAHRGARGLVHHGNTTEAFELALTLGVEWLEFDVRRTADGEWVVHHDDQIGGTAVETLDLASVRALALPLGYRPPTLDEVLDQTRGRARLDVELKVVGGEADVLGRLQRWGSRDHWVVKSFHDRSVHALRRADPEAFLGLLVGVGDPVPWIRTRWSEWRPEARLRRCGADFVGPNEQLVRGSFLRRMARLGVEVWVWTVNDPARMAQLIDAGVDALITDRPDLALPLARGMGAAARGDG